MHKSGTVFVNEPSKLSSTDIRSSSSSPQFSILMGCKRGQLENNPFNGFPLMKVPRKAVRLLSQNEIQRLLTAAKDSVWNAKIMLSKTAGLRRGEVLNLTINDIDFDKGKVIVQPKPDTKSTWRWVVKDKERRELPLIESVAQLLADIITGLPEGQPYLFLSAERYEHLLMLKKSGKLN